MEKRLGQEYKDYINLSPKWQEKRQLVGERENFKCQYCDKCGKYIKFLNKGERTKYKLTIY